ncbi:MAG TPA: hypothetical protein PKA27_12695 [Fimbriimonadaceae bacterium]|nr:hypothetical protein [Fimbriimonadaceae bacterium]
MIGSFLLLALTPLSDRQVLEVKIDGVTRTAIVRTPTKRSAKAPVIFAFHGHGGNGRYAERKMDFHTLWPEAIVVFPTGVPTKTPNDLEGKRNGWQIRPGQDGDRDLKFVDAMLSDLGKKFSVDARVFAMGHSNGARFCFVLWAERADKFRAFAPCCAGGLGLIKDLKPKPAFIMGGKKDAIVDFRSIELSVAGLKQLNESGEGVKGKGPLVHYPSPKGDLVTYLHEGGHEYLSEVNPLIVEFFKRVSRD